LLLPRLFMPRNTVHAVAGRVVFITGAARGIGAELARVLASRGARLALAGLEPDRLAAVARELGSDHAWFDCDVTDQRALDAAVAAAAQTFGRIDVVVANAGIAAIGTVATTPPDALARVLEVNLIGVVRTVAATLPHVLTSRGYYVLVASAASFSAMPGLAVYCASKSGVEHFANALRYELGPRGAAVGTVHPCWIDTDLVRDARADLPTFDVTLPRLPWPFNTVTSVRICAEAIADAIERRKRRTFVPKSLAPFAALRYLLVNPPFDSLLRRDTERMLPLLERDAIALGRSFGAHSAELTRVSER
jgi:NAD(P)-dependent dehydrogenase (short-subunit alcohol dehydrogenase family)